MPVQTVVEDDETLSSTDLRANTLGEFHPVEVKHVTVTNTPLVTRDDAEPADNLQDVESVVLLVEHPNGDEEVLYEYASSLIRYGKSEFCTIKEGDTIWVAEWEDVYRPVLFPGERDYVICRSADQAESMTPRNHPEGRHVAFYLGLFIVGVFAGGAIGSAIGAAVGMAIGSGAGILAFVGCLIGAVAVLFSVDPPGYDGIYSETLAAIAEDANDFDVPAADGEVRSEVANRADAFSSWSEVRVVDTEVESGVVTVTHPLVETVVDLRFEPPRKWDEEYELVRLVEATGVGSVEQLVGESLSVRYGGHHTVSADDAFCTTDGEYHVHTVVKS